MCGIGPPTPRTGPVSPKERQEGHFKASKIKLAQPTNQKISCTYLLELHPLPWEYPFLRLYPFQDPRDCPGLCVPCYDPYNTNREHIPHCFSHITHI